jgi:hypothetical protein
MIRNFALALAILTFTSLAAADLVSDARRVQATLLQNERRINQIANFQTPPKGTPPKLVEMFRKTKSLAEQCLASIKSAKVYAKKIELGDKSDESIKVLQHYLSKLQLAQSELEDSVANLTAAVKALRPSSP